MAINMHMEEVSGNTVGGAGISEDYVRAPIPQKQEVLVQPGYEGYGFGFKGKRRIIKSVFDSFRNFEVETSKNRYTVPIYELLTIISVSDIQSCRNQGYLKIMAAFLLLLAPAELQNEPWKTYSAPLLTSCSKATL